MIAEAFVSIGIDSPEQRRLFLDVCRDLATVARSGVDDFYEIPDEHFRVLDASATYLTQEVKGYEQASRLLEAWYGLDPDRRNFLALHRLGVCWRDWLHEELGRGADLEWLHSLAADARDAFRTSVETVRRLRADPAQCPPRIRPYLERHRHMLRIYHAWATLEGIIGDGLEGSGAHEQAVFLSLLSLDPKDLYQQEAASAVLALSLIRLGELEVAANVTAALAAINPRAYALPNLRRLLKEEGQTVPRANVRLLATGIARIVATLLASGEAVLMWPQDAAERKRHLLEIVETAIQWFSGTSELRDAQRRLLTRR